MKGLLSPRPATVSRENSFNHSVFWVKQSDKLTWATDSLNQLPMGVLQISSQTGMIEWGQKSKPKKISWASNKTTPKIPRQNFTPKKSHAEFPSHKNFQKALKKKKTRKMETSVWIPKKLPPKNTYQNFLTQKNPEMENFKPQKILRSSLSLKIRSTPL